MSRDGNYATIIDSNGNVHQFDGNQTTLISELTGKNITNLCNGNEHSVAWNLDGQVYVWSRKLGVNGPTLEDGVQTESLEPQANNLVIALNLTEEYGSIKSVHCGGRFVILLTDKGQMLSLGDNTSGQLGLGSLQPTNSSEPVLIDFSGTVVKVAVGNYHSLALTALQKVYAWGWNSHGILGRSHQGTLWNRVHYQLFFFQAPMINKFALHPQK